MISFEIYIINRYYGEETPEFFPEVSVHIFQQKTMFLLVKRDFNIFQFGKPAIKGSARARNLPFNDSIDGS